jgi:hypothetical protein
VNCKLSTGLKCGIIDFGMIEKAEDYVGRVARRNWSGTLQCPNTNPVRMTTDDEVWSITLGEWSVPTTISL